MRRVVAPAPRAPPGARRPARPRRRPRRRVGGRHRAAQRPRRERALRLRPGPRREPPRAEPRDRRRARNRPRRRPCSSGSTSTPILLHPEGKPTFSALDRIERAARQGARRRAQGRHGPQRRRQLPAALLRLRGRRLRALAGRGRCSGGMFFMRLATTLLLVVTVWLTWLIAAELFARTWVRTLATGMVALQPKLGFGGGIINPDLMLVMVATGALLMGLRLVRHGPTLGRVLWLAAFAGAGARRAPARALPAAVRGHRARDRARACLAGPATSARLRRRGGGDHVRLRRDQRSRGHRATRAARSPRTRCGGFSARQFVSYLWQFYLPKLGAMYPKVGPAEYGYRQVYIDSYFSAVRLVQRQLPADRPRPPAGPGRHRPRRAVDHGRRRAGTSSSRAGARSRCASSSSWA